MRRELPKPGEKYLHFKNKLYQILCVAEHTETGEKMVVYQALYGAFACYTRPLEMFLGKVDHEKYPEVSQKYRFERVDDTKLQEDSIETEALQKNNDMGLNSSEIQKENDKGTDRLLQENVLGLENLEIHKDANGGMDRLQANTVGLENTEQADPALLRFLDADTLEEKYQLVKSMERSITDRLIDDFSAVLDLVISEGSLDFRYHQLLSSIDTMRRFENTRLR